MSYEMKKEDFWKGEGVSKELVSFRNHIYSKCDKRTGIKFQVSLGVEGGSQGEW